MNKSKKGEPNTSQIKASLAKIAIPALIIFNLAIFSFLAFKGVCFAWDLGKAKITQTVQNEQEEYQDNLLNLLASIESQINFLEEEYKKLPSQKIINLKKKKEILEKLEELEKDGQRLEILFNAYRQDESIKINPLRDLNIEETLNKSWLLPHKIERLARSLEFGIFRGFITSDQGIIIEKDFSGIRYQIEEIKNTWR